MAEPALATNGAPTWTQSQVYASQANAYVTTPALAFDHYGTPSISWSFGSTVGGANTIHYSQLSGLGFWADRQVASDTGIGLRTSLAFDRAERPTVAWVNSDGTVKGQFNFGQTQQIAINPDVNRPVISLGYDMAGSLRGMFAATPSPGANFLSIGYAGSSFSSSSMFNVAGAGTIYDAAMATDYRGLRHVIAREDRGGGSMSVLLASESSSGDWGSTRLVTATTVNGVDIAVDPADGRLALAYTTSDVSPNRSKLYYAKFNGVSLQTTEVLNSTADSFEDVSLAFDKGDGRPAIAFERYVTYSSQQLQFAYLNASSQWLTSVVDSTILKDAYANMPRRPSLAFNDYGTGWPAIAYVDADGSLKVAFDPPAPEPGTAGLLCLGVILLTRRRVSSQNSGAPL